ncbi:MAG TPA: MMPL family transporter [Thermoleophilaceae bacterium]|nr:MMPL family transporter [Thermoleophilaceae bacterium]
MRRAIDFAALVRACVRRPLLAIGVVALLGLGGAVLALQLKPSAGTDTLVSGSSDTARADARFKREFGDDSVVVLVRGDLQRTVLSSDLGRLIRLEGCLSGNVPAKGLADLPPACRELSDLKPARVVFGPGTFVNTAVNQIQGELGSRQQASAQRAEAAARSARQLSKRRGDPPAEQERLARSARQLVQGEFTRTLLEAALRYGITSSPSIDNPEFVDTLVFQRPKQGIQVGEPKPRFAYLFPSRRSALIQVRLRPELSDAERTRTIELVREAVAAPAFKLEQGGKYLTTGVPVIVDGLAREVRSGIFWLLGAALLVMAATLALVFRTRLRLLPLALALAAAAMTFGVLSLTGWGLTMATIAVLPVLIGLAVDYAIQSQARFDEVLERERAGPAAAVPVAAAAGGPTIATAGLATAAGFLVLLLSPVPMVSQFGALLVVGIVIALVCAFTAGYAALSRFGGERRRPEDLPPLLPRLRGRLAKVRATVGGSRPGSAVGGFADAVRERSAGRAERAVAYAVSRPRKVLLVGLAVAVVGWGLDTQSRVVSDVRELVPSDLQELRDVNVLQEETGVSGEIDVTVRADDITDPDVISWMSSFQESTLKAAGYKDGERCAQEKDPPELCPALSLPTLLRTVDAREQSQVRGLLDAVPPYFSQGVVTRDRKTANLAFGIRLQSLADQKEVVEKIKDRLDPPDGVTASVVGLPVLAAEANGALSSPMRRILTLLAALAVVFAVLMAARRLAGERDRGQAAREAGVPLVPIALATGWSGGVLFFLGLLPGPLEVELNPMSVTLGALVIAISTEFSVLLSARYRQERESGAAPAVALELTYRSTGAAVLASGATAIAGFAVLIASDIRMLRDFGILTVVDLSVSLIGVMLVLPAALVWAEEHGPFRLRDLDPRRLLAGLRERPRPSMPRLPRPRRPSLRALRTRRRDV